MKQFPPLKILALLKLCLCCLLISCEKPQLRTEEPEKAPEFEAPQSAQVVETAPPLSPATIEVPEPKPAPSANPEPEVPLEPAYPKLLVYLVGDTLHIEGALRSRMQKARIMEEMAAEFPNWQINDELVQETHRYAVGWGNRVSMGFLIPFFKEVQDPYVGYEEGVVILKGTVDDRRKIRRFQELAISVFAGMFLQDVHNEMTVARK